MSEERSTSLQTGESQELANAEGTRPGRLITPPVDIFEKEGSIIVLADMPGVEPATLNVDLDEGVLTITGHADPPEGEGEADVVREYRTGTFQRKFTLSEAIDQERIEAKVVDGVLRLDLPKVERAKTRKIEVRTA